MGITANDVLDTMRSLIGVDKRKIIDIYNAHKPLAVGYKVQYWDAWCDTTVSVVFIKLNATDLIGGTECGVERHIQLFKKKGIWEEDGNVTPTPGAIICYNWEDDTQPNDGFADHIGIVEKVEGNNITVIEGNFNDAVQRRTIPIGWGNIRGYAFPKYDAETPVSATQKPTEASTQPATQPKTTTQKVDISKPVIDISEWQGVIDWEKVKPQIGGAIIRVAYGTKKNDTYVGRNLEECDRLGIPYGVYIYSLASNATMAKQEAQRALSIVNGRKFIMPIYIDLEENQYASVARPVAKAFCDEIKAAGYRYGIYASESFFNAYIDGVDAPGYSPWIAKYGTNNGQKQNKPNVNVKYDGWQYTSVRHFDGIEGNVDTNEFYNTFDGEGSAPVVNPTPAAPSSNLKSVEEIAKEVIAGKWGNDNLRIQKLSEAGYDANAVQKKVNELLGAASSTPTPAKMSIEEVAKQVINGRWGAGKERIVNLTNAGYDANLVQQKVNELLNVQTTDYITYTVKAGDTLSRIAAKYKTTYQKIAADNNIANPNKIFIGQQLIIKR